MAEREGFEPSKRFPVYTLSKRAPSTTRPPLQIGVKIVMILLKPNFCVNDNELINILILL